MDDPRRAANGGLDLSWLDLAFLGHPDFQSKGSRIPIFKRVLGPLDENRGRPKTNGSNPPCAALWNLRNSPIEGAREKVLHKRISHASIIAMLWSSFRKNLRHAIHPQGWNGRLPKSHAVCDRAWFHCITGSGRWPQKKKTTVIRHKPILVGVSARKKKEKKNSPPSPQTSPPPGAFPSSDTPPPSSILNYNRPSGHLLGHLLPFPRPGREGKNEISETSTKQLFVQEDLC